MLNLSKLIVVDMENVRNLGNGWKEFYSDIFHVQVLAFDEPSRFGINEGRISKLWIKNVRTGRVVCNYDRGWDIEPDESVKNVYNDIIKKYN